MVATQSGISDVEWNMTQRCCEKELPAVWRFCQERDIKTARTQLAWKFENKAFYCTQITALFGVVDQN